MKRDSSPPEAILPIGPKGWPGLVQTSNATRSAPSGAPLRPRAAARASTRTSPARAAAAAARPRPPWRAAPPPSPAPADRRRGRRQERSCASRRGALGRLQIAGAGVDPLQQAARLLQQAGQGRRPATRCLRPASRSANSRSSICSKVPPSSPRLRRRRLQHGLGLAGLDQRPARPPPTAGSSSSGARPALRSSRRSAAPSRASAPPSPPTAASASLSVLTTFSRFMSAWRRCASSSSSPGCGARSASSRSRWRR